MTLDNSAKNRLRLWLRSERALGLPSVAVTHDARPEQSASDQAVAADVLEESRLEPAPPPRAPVVAPTTGQMLTHGKAAPAEALFAPDAKAEPIAMTAPPLSPDEKRARLIALDENEVRGCTKCRLCETRNQTVFGEGSPDARLVFIGEGPGANEDATGRPFVGRAGDLLNRMIAGMGLRREDVYIANVVKCLRYSTLVQLENGSWERIGRLVAQKYAGRVMSVEPDGTLVPKRVTGWYRSPLAGRRVFKLSYASSALRGGNRAVTWLTHDHEVMTRRGWVRAEDVRPDDEIAVGQGLSQVAYEVAVGTLLGDGTVSDKNAYLAFGHCRDQRQYVELKARALSELVPIVYDGVARVKSVGREYLTTRCRTRATRSLRILRGRFYRERRKVLPAGLKLTPRIFAIWFLDDGYTRIDPRRRPLSEIAAHSFSAEDISTLIQCLSRDLGIRGYTLESSPGRIHFGADASRQISEIVAPYCPSCLRYKLDPDVQQLTPFRPELFDAGPQETFFDRVVIEEVPFAGTDKSFFCIDVEDTHNFVTSGGVVHNCRAFLPGPPPKDRAPSADEVATCTPYLQRQLEIIRPEVIVTLGLPASRYMLQSDQSMGRLRGRWHDWRGIRLMPTYHPAYVLRNYTDETRAAVWSDLKQVMAELKLPEPKRGGRGSE